MSTAKNTEKPTSNFPPPPSMLPAYPHLWAPVSFGCLSKFSAWSNASVQSFRQSATYALAANIEHLKINNKRQS